MSDIQAETAVSQARRLNRPKVEAFVRREFSSPQPPPVSERGPLAWIRKNLVSNWVDALLTIACIVFLYWMLAPLFKFTLIDAVWTGKDRSACLGPEVGACWAMVGEKLGIYMYGFYPPMERWRPNVVGATGAILLLALVIPGIPLKRYIAGLLLVVFPVFAFFMLAGGVFGLVEVETARWGGLMLTLVVAVTGITASLPLGILLALGRRSELPIVKAFSIAFIEFWRGVPLITVLFMASVMLPLFLPDGVTFNKLLRALIGVTLFASAYMAEVVRGGLAAIPRGQFEGAQALGLSYPKMMIFIVLPQALKHVIPGIVNTFIGLFKDTTLVYIVGLFDLLEIIKSSFSDVNWSTPVQSATGFIFAAVIFWIFCFAMSQYSQYMEKRLDTGHKR
ncbi:MAG: amino acid ABC transporter permease [Pseudomonadota bacterium]